MGGGVSKAKQKGGLLFSGPKPADKDANARVGGSLSQFLDQ